jgi:prepilin-type processing-associated H-X9-DG protein
LRPSSEVASFFCSNETSVAWTASTHPINREAAATDSAYIDLGGVSTHGFVRGWLPPGFPADHHEQLIYAPKIKEELPGSPGPTNAPGIRTRHMGNKLANIVFMDGHVQSFRYDEMKRKLFCVPPPKL